MHENVMSADETITGVSLPCSSSVQIAELLRKAECYKVGQVRSRICSCGLNCLSIMHEISDLLILLRGNPNGRQPALLQQCANCRAAEDGKTSNKPAVSNL